jgi:hypothetical protein
MLLAGLNSAMEVSNDIGSNEQKIGQEQRPIFAPADRYS